MYQRLEQRLRALDTQHLAPHLQGSAAGLEKESLRVTPQSRLAHTPHPRVLGSALTHPWITTDYSESLLELITPPQRTSEDALDFLLSIEAFVYQQLKDELLWTTSMPCVLAGEDDIPIAEYGNSNAGRMKHIYRQGLAWRYGKTMQVIAGVHFNYSVSEDFWPIWQRELAETDKSLRVFTDQQYMNITRNLLRYGWLILYLFGSSPAVCRSFLSGRTPPATMQEFDAHTLYEPFGTSLRMGNIGYNNRKEKDTGVRVSYNSLDEYISGLKQAINTSWPAYEDIGVKVNGEYRQLNTNILQIENEYYSSVRPKQPLEGFEKPTVALTERGIRYLELRSVDINAFHPAGLTRLQLAFLEVFMHFCLLQESPLLNAADMEHISQNQALVAHQGRKPGLLLQRSGEPIDICVWSGELLKNMEGVADLLDQSRGGKQALYREAVASQQELVCHQDLTPSARMLEEMRENKESFFCFAHRKSLEHRDYFLQQHIPAALQHTFEQMAKTSLEKQQLIESSDQISLDDFLECYFAGTL